MAALSTPIPKITPPRLRILFVGGPLDGASYYHDQSQEEVEALIERMLATWDGPSGEYEIGHYSGRMVSLVTAKAYWKPTL